MLKKIKETTPDPFQLRRPIYVVCNDTLVYNPIISSYVDDVMIEQSESESVVDVWGTLFEIVKVILWIMVALVVIGSFTSKELTGVATWFLIICGLGALIGWWLFDNGRAGVLSCGYCRFLSILPCSHCDC